MTEEQRKYLEELRKNSALTHQQIAELSGVPVGTVSRILAGQTKDPGFCSIAGIVVAMGGSLDEFIGIIREHHTPNTSEVRTSQPDAYDKALTASRDAFTHAYESIQDQHEIELKRVKEYLSIKDKWLCIMFIYCVTLTMILAAVSILRR